MYGQQAPQQYGGGFVPQGGFQQQQQQPLQFNQQASFPAPSFSGNFQAPAASPAPASSGTASDNPFAKAATANPFGGSSAGTKAAAASNPFAGGFKEFKPKDPNAIDLGDDGEVGFEFGASKKKKKT